MIRRVLAALIGFISAGNGLVMLAASRRWFEGTPGVGDTGPFNPHFVDDVGVAYLVAGSALLARAAKPRYWPAAVAGAAFFVGHAIIHLAGLGHSRHALFEIALVVVPAAIALWAAFPAKGERHA